MKKLILILSIAFTANTIANAQIPNPGFENWTAQSSYDEPQNWATLNVLSQFPLNNPVSVFKATDMHGGNYACKITVIRLTNNPAPTLIKDSVGFAFTGALNPFGPSINYGFPCTARPDSLKFYSRQFTLNILFLDTLPFVMSLLTPRHRYLQFCVAPIIDKQPNRNNGQTLFLYPCF